MHILIRADYKELNFYGLGAIVTDPPYGSTQNQWDSEPAIFVDTVLPWCEDDSSIVTTTDMRYACRLLAEHSELFSHDLVWAKTVGSGQLNIARRPLRNHENILVFHKGRGFYRRVKEQGEPYTIHRNIKSADCYGKQVENVRNNPGERDRKTVVTVPNPRKKGGHPTQKPVALWQWLCDSYGKGIVLDPFAGSGTILDVVGFDTIGVEVSDEYYRAAITCRQDRVTQEKPTDELLKCIPALQAFEHTIFSPKG